MAWTVWVCDTITGAKRQKLPPSAFSWSRVLNASGSGSATVRLLDSVTKKLNVKSLTVPVANTLVLDWDGTVVYAGVIWNRKYDRGTGTLTLDHGDLWSLFAKRHAIDYTAPHVEVTKQVYTSLDLGTIAKRRVQLATTGDSNRNLALPITYPGDLAGSVTRTFYGYALDWVASELEDIVNEGPDVDFQPRWVSNKLNYLMRVGRTPSNLLDVGSWEWNLAATRPQQFGLTVAEDANKLGTAAYVIGEGSEVDMLVHSNADLTSPYPAVQNSDTHKDISDDDQAAALANANLKAFKQPTEQWGFSMLADGKPSVADLQVGGTASVYVMDDPWLGNGWKHNRLIQYSGDLSNTVNLQFQPGRA